MSEQLDKVKLVKGKKWERKDPIDNIGVSTYALIKDAIKEGKFDLAKDLVDYLYFWEMKFVRDANIDVVGGLPAWWMYTYGEDGFDKVYRDGLTHFMGLSSFPVPPIKKRDISPVEWAMDYAARMVRPHRMGRRDGTEGFTLEEYDDRIEVVWDPCYTGGRTQRGDPISGQPPHTASPYNYPVSKVPHRWTWGKTGLTGYCIHCCVLHSLMDIEQTGGYMQQWVTGYPDNPWEPCRYIAYKDLDWIPEECYTVIGKTKPKAASKVPAPKNPKLVKVTHSEDLGTRWINKQPQLQKAIEEGNKEKALELVDHLDKETGLWQFFYPIRWIWTWIDLIADRHGYNELYNALRWVHSAMEPRLAPSEKRPTKAEIPNAEERVRKAAAWGRGERSGPNESSSVTIMEEPGRYVMELNPCGSGGRNLLRMETVDDLTMALAKDLKTDIYFKLPITPLVEPPLNFGITKEAHAVSWGKVGIPHYCTRCCAHFEIGAVARHGYLTTVVERPENHTNPNCRWFFYKDLDDIPEEYYTRIGARKPKPQS